LTFNIFRRWKIENSTSSIIPKEGTHNIPWKQPTKTNAIH
jgi:hypothetical protein